jgi:hypothetical protein
VEAFVARELEQANPTRWAWNNLDPPTTMRIDLGSGLDWGYVDGFETSDGVAEKPDNFRWSRPQARLRFVGAGAGVPQTLYMRVASGRSPDEPPVQLRVTQTSPTTGGPPSTHRVEIGSTWQTIKLPLAGTLPGENVVVELQSPAYVPRPEQLPDRQQLRGLLGVQVDWAELN